MKKTPVKVEPVSLRLVSEGKSSRLLNVRKPSSEAAAVPLNNPTGLSKADAVVWQQAQRLIDLRLGEVLSQYPAGKTGSLFKMRHGMTVEQLKDLPIKQIFAVLKIEQSALTHQPKLAEINYYGN